MAKVKTSSKGKPAPAARAAAPAGSVQIVILDVNRNEVCRTFVPLSELHAFRVQFAGQFYEKVGSREGLDAYAPA